MSAVTLFTLFDAPRVPRAVFDGPYRYFLEWPTGINNDKALMVCAANPSIAGQALPDGSMRSDHTISRMRGLARDMEFGWLWMVNARSWIATDPRKVPPDPEAIGPLTDHYITEAAAGCELALMAYGHLAGERGPQVLKLVRDMGKVPHALKLNAGGIPAHPRGLPKSARPFPMMEKR